MHEWFLLLHLVGLIMWFGTMAVDAFYIPASRRGDAALQVWVFGTYRRAIWLELIGLALLLTGGIGMVITETELLGETWFLVKVGAAVIAIALRATHYVVLFRDFQPNPALPGAAGTPGGPEVQDTQGVERYESLSRWAGPLGLIFVIIVFWMVLWRPI
jgi:hypothetical protein